MLTMLDMSTRTSNSQAGNVASGSKLIEYQWPLAKEADFFVLKDNAVSFLETPLDQFESLGENNHFVLETDNAFGNFHRKPFPIIHIRS